MIDSTQRSRLFELFPFLNKVDPVVLEPALKSAVIERYRAGQQMWTEQERIDHFPFVIKGFGRVYKLAPNGRELLLYFVGPGDPCVLASGSMIGGSTVNARAMCEADYEMICIPLSIFKTLLAQSEPFREYVLSDLTFQLDQLTEMVSAIVFQNLDQRLASALVSKVNPIQATHQALAEELGSVREIVSRILKNFAGRGWISLSRGQIHVLKAQELIDFSNPDGSVT